jgi:hypothetical protein
VDPLRVNQTQIVKSTLMLTIGALVVATGCRSGERLPPPSKVLAEMYDTYEQIGEQLSTVTNRPSAIAVRPAIQQQLPVLEKWIALEARQREWPQADSYSEQEQEHARQVVEARDVQAVDALADEMFRVSGIDEAGKELAEELSILSRLTGFTSSDIRE